MLTAHERASSTRNLKSMIVIKDEENEVHIDNTAARLSRDENNVKKVIQVIKGWCNPFEDVTELTCLSPGVAVSDDIAKELLSAKQIGETATQKFIDNRIVTNEVGFYEVLPKKKLKTFESASMKNTVVVAGKEEILKADRKIFARLTVIAQTCELDMQNVLKYELGPILWSIAATDGTVAKTVKSKIVEVLEKNVQPIKQSQEFPVWVFDAMAIIQSIVCIPRTFSELAMQVLNVLINYGMNVARIDFVGDRYPLVSIKNAERQKRAKGGSLTIANVNGGQKCPKQ